jgi:CRISPR system Cascade subunit CasE
VEQFEITIDSGRGYLIKAPAKQEYMLRTQDFSGVLTVADPEIFVKSLYNGIGAARAFGCGLMLVRRI